MYFSLYINKDILIYVKNEQIYVGKIPFRMIKLRYDYYFPCKTC